MSSAKIFGPRIARGECRTTLCASISIDGTTTSPNHEPSLLMMTLRRQRSHGPGTQHGELVAPAMPRQRREIRKKTWPGFVPNHVGPGHSPYRFGGGPGLCGRNSFSQRPIFQGAPHQLTSNMDPAAGLLQKSDEHLPRPRGPRRRSQKVDLICDALQPKCTSFERRGSGGLILNAAREAANPVDGRFRWAFRACSFGSSGRFDPPQPPEKPPATRDF